MERRSELQRRTQLRRSGPLERRTGLTARTPLPRGPFQAGGGGLKRSGPLPRTSAKRDAENAARRPVIAALKAAQVAVAGSTFCERCGRHGPVDGHEKLSRARGGSITDPENIALLCRTCHDDVTFRHHEIPDADLWVWSRKGAA